MDKPIPTSPGEPLIFRPDLQVKLGVCSETMRRWMKAGTLPPPDVAMSRKKQGWKLSTLAAAGIRI